MDRVVIFDTTLRDGEQSPGATLNAGQKLEIARQLARLGVDIIEAGFPISSPDEFEAVRADCRDSAGARLSAPSLALNPRMWMLPGARSRAPASPGSMCLCPPATCICKHQFRKTRAEAIEATREMVARARGYCADVEFSPMDATRTDPAYLYQVLDGGHRGRRHDPEHS